MVCIVMYGKSAWPNKCKCKSQSHLQVSIPNRIENTSSHNIYVSIKKLTKKMMKNKDVSPNTNKQDQSIKGDQWPAGCYHRFYKFVTTCCSKTFRQARRMFKRPLQNLDHLESDRKCTKKVEIVCNENRTNNKDEDDIIKDQSTESKSEPKIESTIDDPDELATLCSNNPNVVLSVEGGGGTGLLSARNQSNQDLGCVFSTGSVCPGDSVYFEVTLVTVEPNPIAIGWSWNTFKELDSKAYPDSTGDALHLAVLPNYTLAYNGWDGQGIIHQLGEQTFSQVDPQCHEQTDRWKAGDVVGCLLLNHPGPRRFDHQRSQSNTLTDQFVFYLNGKRLDYDHHLDQLPPILPQTLIGSPELLESNLNHDEGPLMKATIILGARQEVSVNLGQDHHNGFKHFPQSPICTRSLLVSAKQCEHRITTVEYDKD